MNEQLPSSIFARALQIYLEKKNKPKEGTPSFILNPTKKMAEYLQELEALATNSAQQMSDEEIYHNLVAYIMAQSNVLGDDEETFICDLAADANLQVTSIEGFLEKLKDEKENAYREKQEIVGRLKFNIDSARTVAETALAREMDRIKYQSVLKLAGTISLPKQRELDGLHRSESAGAAKIEIKLDSKEVEDAIKKIAKRPIKDSWLLGWFFRKSYNQRVALITEQVKGLVEVNLLEGQARDMPPGKLINHDILDANFPGNDVGLLKRLHASVKNCTRAETRVFGMKKAKKILEKRQQTAQSPQMLPTEQLSRDANVSCR